MYPIGNLVSLERERKPTLATEAFPRNTDTASVASTVTGHSKETISVMDEMFTYANKDGIIQVGR